MRRIPITLVAGAVVLIHHWAAPAQTPLAYVVPGRSPVLPAPRPVAVSVVQPPTLPPPARAVAPPEITLPPPARATAPARAESRATMLATMNAGRARAGLPPFVMDARLNEGAQVHSVAVASGRQPLGHAGFPGRYHAAGFPQEGTLSEGVFPEAPGVDLNFWITWLLDPKQSREAHSLDFRNKSYRLIGIGYAAGSGGGYSGVWTIGYSDLDIDPVSPNPPTPVPPTKPTPPVINPPPTGPAPPVVVVRPSPQGNPPGPNPAGVDAWLADPDFVRAAATYHGDVPLIFRSVAGQVRAGKYKTINEVVGAIEEWRKASGKPLADQVDKAMRTASDDAGNILVPSGVADVLDAAGAAMSQGGR